MPLTPFPFPSLGRGLNLRDAADAVEPDAAIDCIDVEYTERGVVKERAGYSKLTSSALTNRAASLEAFYTTSGTKQLIAGCDTRLEALNTAGGIVASLTGLTSGIWDFARMGTPGNEYLYAGQGSDTLRRWDGAAWTSPGAAMPAAGALAVMPTSNRLVAGRYNGLLGGPAGAISSPSYVYFSNPGASETWGANNFIQVTPGDGEKVQAIVAWREFIFIFKESKFFVVTGESVDGSGNPVFNYRPVDAGVGLASPRAVAVSDSGVYFMDRRGCYITTGGEPKLVSDMIRPVFQGNASPYYLGGVMNNAAITSAAATFFNNRLYLAVPTVGTPNDRVFVWDEPGQWWSVYDMPAAAMCTFRPSNDVELVFARAAGTNDIDRHNASLTSDEGAAITSRWRGGWFDFAGTTQTGKARFYFPNQKRVAEVKVWGSGKPLIGLSTDFNLGVGVLEQLDMTVAGLTQWDGSTWGGGTWAVSKPVIPNLTNATSGEGTHFSVYFENNTLNTGWSAHRLSEHVAGAHIPSVIGN